MIKNTYSLSLSPHRQPVSDTSPHSKATVPVVISAPKDIGTAIHNSCVTVNEHEAAFPVQVVPFETVGSLQQVAVATPGIA
jgi:hypothetical protein